MIGSLFTKKCCPFSFLKWHSSQQKEADIARTKRVFLMYKYLPKNYKIRRRGRLVTEGVSSHIMDLLWKISVVNRRQISLCSLKILKNIIFTLSLRCCSLPWYPAGLCFLASSNEELTHVASDWLQWSYGGQ